LDITTEVSTEYVCNTIRNLEEDEWFVLLFHHIRTPILGKYDVTVEKFESILSCISEKDVLTTNITEGYDLIQENYPTVRGKIPFDYNKYESLPDSVNYKDLHIH